MVYEVAWTRALALVIGSSTYAFSAMLVAFLVGIAGGAAAYSYFRGARRAGAATFATIQAGIGLSVALVVLVFERMPQVFLLALQHSQSPEFVQAVQVMVSSLALLGPALLIGATFPCAMAACASTAERAGADTGRLYALNTLGAIGGTMLTGFLLVPAIGVHASIVAGIATNLLLAAALFVAPLRGVPAAGDGPPSAVASPPPRLVFLLPQWNAGVMSSGAAIYAMQYLPVVRDGKAGVGAQGAGDHLLPRRAERDGRGGAVRRDLEPQRQRQSGRLEQPGGHADPDHARPPAAAASIATLATCSSSVWAAGSRPAPWPGTPSSDWTSWRSSPPWWRPRASSLARTTTSSAIPAHG